MRTYCVSLAQEFWRQYSHSHEHAMPPSLAQYANARGLTIAAREGSSPYGCNSSPPFTSPGFPLLGLPSPWAKPSHPTLAREALRTKTGNVERGHRAWPRGTGARMTRTSRGSFNQLRIRRDQARAVSGRQKRHAQVLSLCERLSNSTHLGPEEGERVGLAQLRVVVDAGHLEEVEDGGERRAQPGSPRLGKVRGSKVDEPNL